MKHIKRICKADWVQEEGFVENARLRHDGAVVLYDTELIEDDAPGAGHSVKGSFQEPLRRGVRVRKELVLSNNRAKAAKVLFHVRETQGNSNGLLVGVNGHPLRLAPLQEAYPEQKNRWVWQYLEFPVEWLVKGTNQVIIWPEGDEENAAWTLDIARADEFAEGGGGDRTPGERSAKSKDHGGAWSAGLGDTDDVTGEYLIRFNLTRYVPRGVLTSPVIDMWSEPSDEEEIKLAGQVKSASLEVVSSTAEDTSVTWQVRTGGSFDPHGTGWGEWRTISTAAEDKVAIPGPLQRYLQWRAILTTSNPVVTPAVREVIVEDEVVYASAAPSNIFLVDQHNEKIEYSSVPFEYENPDEPKLAELRNKYHIDEVVKGAATDFEEMVLLREWTARQWVYGSPIEGYGTYPAWDALEIMSRAKQSEKKCGGMCMQYAIVMIQALISRGIQARHINYGHHEVVEAWSNEYKKWVFMDPTMGFDLHNYDLRTGEPLGMLEMSYAFAAKYADGPADWRRGYAPFALKLDRGETREQPIGFSTTTPDGNANSATPPGYNLAGHVRMMPRNNYFSKPTPRPLAHGMTAWPWNGYLNWEVPRIGCMVESSWCTDRERDFWPTLNQVRFDATYGSGLGTLELHLVTFTPGFDTFLINADGKGWVESPAQFTWQLHPGRNRLEMRPRSKWGRDGVVSYLSVSYQPSE